MSIPLFLDDRKEAERQLTALAILVEAHQRRGKARVTWTGQVVYEPDALKEHVEFMRLRQSVRLLDESVYAGMSNKLKKLCNRRRV
jgi:hypothetical protein